VINWLQKGILKAILSPQKTLEEVEELLEAIDAQEKDTPTNIVAKNTEEEMKDTYLEIFSLLLS
jgi:NTP pyrophosphatase (non-canonical NTP hydrolase)